MAIPGLFFIIQIYRVNKLPSLASFSSFGAIDRILQKIQGFKRWTSIIWFNHCASNAGAASSVTRLGDLLDYGPLFKAFGNN